MCDTYFHFIIVQIHAKITSVLHSTCCLYMHDSTLRTKFFFNSPCTRYCTEKVHILFRSVSGILWMTRETIIALTTNIESREWRRREGIEPEHPRASTTDDVECLFSIMRDLVGSHFTLQTVKYNWRKVCNEFSKRLDPANPFYYHTSTHDRFYEGDRPSFDEQGTSKNNPRTQRPRLVEQLYHMQGRMTIPNPGERSTRSTYHNKPLEQPPPPSRINPLSDHSYAGI